jgi:hypothetical protein
MIRWRAAIVVAVGALALASVVHAQWGWGREGSYPPRFPPEHFSDGGFTICKAMYTMVRREPGGIGWATDYPDAARHLMIRASELTSIRISKDTQNEPNFWVVRFTDDAIFQCPMVFATDVGTMGLSQPEADRLRDYLLKGGFLWVDDFWGTDAWDQWVHEISKALPAAEYPIIDLPRDHIIFRTLHQIDQVPQVTSIQNWRRTGGATSERGADSDEVHFRAITDRRGRIIVLMSHNTDLGDSWEREGEDPAFFYQFSPPGYSVGINVLLYGLTH